MLQRNVRPYPVDLPTVSPPVTVESGELYDHPTLLAGFAPAEVEVPETSEVEPVEPVAEVEKDEDNRPSPTPRRNGRRGPEQEG